MRGKPRADRAFRNIDVHFVAKDALGLADRMAEVIERERFEYLPERIGFVSSGISGKSVLTLIALQKRNRLKTIPPLSFFHDVCRIALGAARCLLLDLGWHGWCAELRRSVGLTTLGTLR